MTSRVAIFRFKIGYLFGYLGRFLELSKKQICDFAKEIGGSGRT